MDNSFDWASAVSAICSVVSLLAIVVLLKERNEKQRPYLQVSFELVKSSLVCLVIRNVGETPAQLKEILFNEDFVEQLPESAKDHAKDRRNLNISIYPKQQWVLCLDVITPTVLNYQNTQLEITYTYLAKGKKHKYTEIETIDFMDYSGFLVYISQMDELTNQVKKLGDGLETLDKNILKIANANMCDAQTQSYVNLSDKFTKTFVTGTKETTILGKSEE